MKFPRRQFLPLTAGAAALPSLSRVAQAQTDPVPPVDVNTRIGSLAYQAGPTKATVETLYNEMDFQRAVLAYQYADTLVSYYSMNVAFKAAGANDGDLAIWERFLDPKTIALTGNNTTIYALGFLDLDKEGRMVVEVTPGPVYGALFDLWQVPTGAITEQGGMFVVTTDDFKGSVPAGATLIKSRTKLAGLVLRGLVRNDDVVQRRMPWKSPRCIRWPNGFAAPEQDGSCHRKNHGHHPSGRHALLGASGRGHQ